MKKIKSWLLEPVKDEPSEQKGVMLLKQILSVDENKLSGLISLSISWKNPKLLLNGQMNWLIN